MSSLPPVLSCQNITKRFDKAAAAAVSDISFELHQGELMGLLGPSGCGKTTLLRVMAGFERPETGEILLSSQPVCGKGLWLPPEKRQVGVVFQDYALFPHLSVIENVAFGLKQLCRRGELPKQQIHKLASESIRLVGLSGMEKRYPHALSGGQQQRVALARALAPRPPLILMDEPFSNLDVQVRLRLRQEVRDILKNVGASGIFVTHDQEEALAIADKVAVMNEGKLMQLDSPEAIYQTPKSRFVAKFVTQANFLPAVKVAGGWQTDLGVLKLEPVLGDGTSNEQAGDLMIAQEDLQLVPDVRGSLLVQGRQFLGREYQYLLMLEDGRELEARSPVGTRLEVGDRVSVKINRDHVHFFPTAGDAVAMRGTMPESPIVESCLSAGKL